MYKKMVLFSAVLLLSSAAWAAGNGNEGGHGQGRTKIDFRVKAGDPTADRLFAKLDVASTLSQLGTSGTPSKNDDLAGYSLTLTVGSADFASDVANEKGKITNPFNAKLTANGGILQIKAGNLNLEQLIPIDTSDGEHQATVTLKVTASKTTTDAQGVQTTQSFVLSDQQVTFFYKVKNGQAKGKNF